MDRVREEGAEAMVTLFELVELRGDADEETGFFSSSSKKALTSCDFAASSVSSNLIRV